MQKAQGEIKHTQEFPLPAAWLHSLRSRILSFLLQQGKASGKEIAEALSHSRSSVGDQLRHMEAEGLVEVVETHKRRGAVERYYIYTPQSLEIEQHETDFIPERQRKMLALHLLRSFVSLASAALSRKGPDVRKNSHWSTSTMRIDPEGWRQLVAIHGRAISEVERVRAECHRRLDGKSPDTFVVASSNFLFEVPDEG